MVYDLIFTNRPDQNKTVSLAATKQQVCTINKAAFKVLQIQGAIHTRVYAKHSTDIKGKSLVSEEIAHKLNKTTLDKYDPPYLDLAIGSRVRISQNIGTQIGIGRIIIIPVNF